VLARPRIVARLDERWRVPVLTVVAGAGFGKSVALGQARRAQAVSPVGVEALVSCRRVDDPDHFVDLVAAGLGVRATQAGLGVRATQAGLGAPARRPGRTPADPARRLAALVTDLAPLAVCLALDDVEHLDAAPACRALVGDLLAADPAHLHLVLCGRRLPELPLARRWAAGQVGTVTEDDLRFTPAEVADLRRTAGAAVPVGDDHDWLAGWPALVRLALAAPAGAVGDYLLEEVAAGLTAEDRRALFALVTLGRADAGTIAAVTGAGLDPGAFARRVPLVTFAEATLAAHDLWTGVVDALVPAGEAAALRAAALRHLREQGAVEAAGSLAGRLGDGDTLAWAAIALVGTRLSRFPIALAERWLEQWPGPSCPERELLALAVGHRRRVSGPDLGRLDAVVAELAATGCRRRTTAGLALAAVVAEAHGDLGRLLALAERARSEPGALDQPTLALLVAGVDAARAAAAGDHAAAVAGLDRPITGLTLGDRPEAVNRFHWHLLVLCGRAREAAELIDACPVGTGAAARGAEADQSVTPAVSDPLAAVARWFDGDPRALAAEPVDPLTEGYDGLGDRARFDRAAFVAVIAASQGRAAVVDEAVAVMAASGVVPLAPAHHALLAVARAVQHIVHLDEAAAADVLRRFLASLTDRSPGERRSAHAHLRRSAAVPYLCLPEIRSGWDAEPLGPTDIRTRAVARALVDARERGEVAATAPAAPGAVLTALPLPLAVELAARATAAGAPWGLELACGLLEGTGAAVAAEVDRQRAGPDEVLRAGAAQLRAGLRLAPRPTVRIELLGPLQIRRGGRLVGGGAVRRSRVRALLSLLAVDTTVSREVVLDRLWPDLDPDRARANLRVTLTHLHAVLEPDRARGDAPTIVQADATHLRLVPGPGLEVDLHEARAHLAAADRARSAGDEGARRQHLAAAVAPWRGRPLPDLDGVVDGPGAAEEISLALLAAVVSLGELHLVAGDDGMAAACARRALAADGFCERAHRLAIAAPTQAGDAVAARAALDALDKALSELGVPADDDSDRVVRQAARRFGW
jgi:LuxR family maltose regulon positive regulatory protein